jgi:hypothetical protein
MPCGGIYPVKNLNAGSRDKILIANEGGCWVCGRGGCHHFMDEWDTFIHATCAIKDLQNPDSDTFLVVLHGHQIYLDTTLEQPAT